jgi:hypothetical protein
MTSIADSHLSDLWGRNARALARSEVAAARALLVPVVTYAERSPRRPTMTVPPNAQRKLGDTFLRLLERDSAGHGERGKVACWRCPCGYVLAAKYGHCTECGLARG